MEQKLAQIAASEAACAASFPAQRPIFVPLPQLQQLPHAHRQPARPVGLVQRHHDDLRCQHHLDRESKMQSLLHHPTDSLY